MHVLGRILVTALLLAACRGKVSPSPGEPTPGHDMIPQDNTPKAGPRLIPPEAYIRTYLTIFGGLSPEEAEGTLASEDLFDTWSDYLSSLGLPQYAEEVSRAEETNAVMLATFERLGVALCARALEHDLKALPPRPLEERLVFAFEPSAGSMDLEAFGARFDVLHRTFLGYPAALAPEERVGRFFQLYTDTTARHREASAPPSLFSPDEAGWAAVCYGLVRHPEFHLY